MPRPYITQGNVVCRQALSDAIIGLVKSRNGHVSKFGYDGFPKGKMLHHPSGEMYKAPLNEYFLRVTAVRAGSTAEYDVRFVEDGDLEFNRDAKQDEIYDCYVEWLDRVLPAKKLGIVARIKRFLRRK